MGPQNLPENIRRVQERIKCAAAACGRSVDSVTLLAVCKSQPPQVVRAAALAGLADFGESYVQEALGKIAALSDLALTWHFVGQIQANKTRDIAENFAWVHGVDRLRIAERLSAQRPYHAPPLNVCLQVNVEAEASKGGVAPSDVPELARQVASLPRLLLRGLMCIPAATSDRAAQRRPFAELAQLLARVNADGARLDTLSMGMSADLEAAILEGATLVRVGTALFGARS
ncbi:MAG TPA: YggS family pyridoxal phosphate-dependent enzyme [Steroidobacteraceae bacterium]|nr:YggS family pyridoxal phosphate-dependent enzyme [Steroidobacteraceae bacterium]